MNCLLGVNEKIDTIFETIQRQDSQHEVTEELKPCTCQSFMFDHTEISGYGNAVQLNLPFVWQLFIERVDPFIKVLHTPAMEHLFTSRKLKDEVDVLITYSVSLAAVTACEEDLLQIVFGIPKTQLQQSLRSITEEQLSKVRFLSSRDIKVAQALAIYVFTLPYMGGDDVVAQMTGILLQIILGICSESKTQKLDDGTEITEERETRKRLWWHTCFLARRSLPPKMQRALDPDRPEDGLDFPADLNDVDLESHLTTSTSKPGQTTVCLIRCELWTLSHFIGQYRGSDLAELLDSVQTCKRRVFTKYLPDPPISPWESFLSTMTTLFFSKIEQSIYGSYLRHLSSSCDETKPDRQKIRDALKAFYGTSLQALQSSYDLSANVAWDKWTWQQRGQFPWHAMRAIFLILCNGPWTELSEQSWILANSVLQKSLTVISHLPEWSSLEKLMKRVADKREDAMARAAASSLNDGQVTDLFNAGPALFYGSAALGKGGPSEIKQPTIPQILDVDVDQWVMSHDWLEEYPVLGLSLEYPLQW